MQNNFPDDFLWGASTSAYQVEGGNFDSDWAEWEKSSSHEECGRACEHYSRFEEDFQIAKELGHNAHRLGLEWSRLESAEGVWRDNEWEHYRNILDRLLEKNIEPILTLHHFTLPLWLSEKGGWLNPDSPSIFASFAEKAARELGSRVKYWITINEPNILAILAYFWGQWPPCHKNFNEAITVLKNMLRAHALSYGIIKKFASGNCMVGVAKAVTAFHPYSLFSPLDRAATFARSRFHNYTFISSLLNGRIEFDVLKKEKLNAARTLDFIGLNYYFRQFIRGHLKFCKNPFGEVVSPPPHAGKREITDMGWEVYSEGLYEVAKAFSKYSLPLLVTENGIATTDDEKRVSYIQDHLTALQKAIGKGVPVKGYLHWSLLDNFEWDSGYSKKFGLVDVNFSTMQRTIRPSARHYSETIRLGTVS
jgi:beta-glucosidase